MSEKMKTRPLIIIIIACVLIGSTFTIFDTLNYFETNQKIEEYSTSPIHKPDSNMPYPAYDGLRFYFGIGVFLFVSCGPLYVIWRKRK